MTNYNTKQYALSISLDYIPEKNDISRIIDALIDSIPDSTFQPFYQAEGRPRYSPKMMLKIILCGYSLRAFSGRKIEDLVKDSKRMGWLAQGTTPSYRTINRMRVHPLMTKVIEEAYVQLHCQLVEQKMIDGDAIYIDGTKIEANANKYSFVWRKSVENYQKAMFEKAKEMYSELLKQNIIPELKNEVKAELSEEQLTTILHHLDESIGKITKEIENSESVEMRKPLRTKRKLPNQCRKQIADFIQRMKKYEIHLNIMGTRNSYSKIDSDATFMRMKDDHMKNGQLKAGYNLQIATQNQFTLAFDVFSNPTDTRTLRPFLETIRERFFELPKYIVADAGYGSEENYEEVIDTFERTPLMPYGMYEKEKTKKWKNNIFQPMNWKYLEDDDVYVCPNKKKLSFKKYSTRTDKYGFERSLKLYECEDCMGCPFRTNCTKAKSDKPKVIQKNMNWEYFKAYTNEKLSDEKTSAIYKQRKIDVEPVFGFLKANLSFTRMSVRGQSKVRNELGIALMAVNMRKLTAMRRNFLFNKSQKHVLGNIFISPTHAFSLN